MGLGLAAAHASGCSTAAAAVAAPAIEPLPGVRFEQLDLAGNANAVHAALLRYLPRPTVHVLLRHATTPAGTAGTTTWAALGSTPLTRPLAVTRRASFFRVPQRHGAGVLRTTARGPPAPHGQCRLRAASPSRSAPHGAPLPHVCPQRDVGAGTVRAGGQAGGAPAAAGRRLCCESLPRVRRAPYVSRARRRAGGRRVRSRGGPTLPGACGGAIGCELALQFSFAHWRRHSRP